MQIWSWMSVVLLVQLKGLEDGFWSEKVVCSEEFHRDESLSCVAFRNSCVERFVLKAGCVFP